VTKVLLDQFRWSVNELGFLELVLGRAQMLERAVLVLDSGMSSEEVTRESGHPQTGLSAGFREVCQ
jgi:hypothetical protein